MQANVTLEDKLVKEAMELSGISNFTTLMNEALAEFIRYKTQKSIVELKGKVEFWPGYREEICPAGPVNG
jgi:hypothetical protein